MLAMAIMVCGSSHAKAMTFFVFTSAWPPTKAHQETVSKWGDRSALQSEPRQRGVGSAVGAVAAVLGEGVRGHGDDRYPRTQLIRECHWRSGGMVN